MHIVTSLCTFVNTAVLVSGLQ